MLLGGRRPAFVAAMLLAVSLATVAEAHIAKTDAALLAAITAGQGALGLAYTRARGRAPVGLDIAAAFWLAELTAIFLKGPVGPGIALATAATLSIADRDVRWLRGLRPVIGLGVVALALLPWLYAIEHATEGQFFSQSLGGDFLAKVAGGQESHGLPPLYYLGLAFVTFWPGSLYLVPGVVRGWAAHRQLAIRFLLAWLVPAWIVLELVPTKLPHYVLPLYPALAQLAGFALTGAVTGPRWARWTETGGIALWAVVTIALAGALIVAPISLGSGIMVPGVIGAAAVITLAVVLLYRPPGPAGIAALLAAVALAFIIPAAGAVVPGLDRLWLSRGAAAMLTRHKPPDGTALTVIGYNEPSLVFLLGNAFKTGVGRAGERRRRARSKAGISRPLSGSWPRAAGIDRQRARDQLFERTANDAHLYRIA